MHILITGDWHIRTTSPRYRTDDYYSTLMGKLSFIFALAKEKGCGAILQPGDFFDGPDQSNKVEIDLINLFKEKNIPIYTVLGQHDLRHRNADGTALTKFDAIELVEIVSNDPIRYEGNIHIYGASWEEEIPEVINKDAVNILVMHKMVINGKPLWPGQTDYITAKSMLPKYDDYNLIVSGDNHQHFTYGEKSGSILINCGSLMRTNVTQRDHQPVVYIVDMETQKMDQYLIPIAPIEDVMELELADEIKERNEALEAFMTSLSSDYAIDVNFEENLKSLMATNETSDHVKTLANKFLGKYYEGIK